MADTATKPAEEPKAKTESLLEEDDEFEEFDTEEWTEQQEDPNVERLWEDDWDDDDMTDDFSNQLKRQLAQK